MKKFLIPKAIIINIFTTVSPPERVGVIKKDWILSDFANSERDAFSIPVEPILVFRTLSELSSMEVVAAEAVDDIRILRKERTMRKNRYIWKNYIPSVYPMLEKKANTETEMFIIFFQEILYFVEHFLDVLQLTSSSFFPYRLPDLFYTAFHRQ